MGKMKWKATETYMAKCVKQVCKEFKIPYVDVMNYYCLAYLEPTLVAGLPSKK
jgi:predicted solute-binding protein